MNKVRSCKVYTQLQVRAGRREKMPPSIPVHIHLGWTANGVLCGSKKAPGTTNCRHLRQVSCMLKRNAQRCGPRMGRLSTSGTCSYSWDQLSARWVNTGIPDHATKTSLLWDMLRKAPAPIEKHTFSARTHANGIHGMEAIGERFVFLDEVLPWMLCWRLPLWLLLCFYWGVTTSHAGFGSDRVKK